MRLFKGPMADDGPLLAAEDLACVRGEHLVFADLGFALAPGAALLLTGPNGSGKSSLLRLVAGLLRPAEGRVLWRDADIRDDPDEHRRRLRYVSHQDPVKPVLSVGENLEFWARLQGAEGASVGPALARFGLASLADLPGRVLSAGQRRRLNLARLLLGPAPLWLLDEPTSGLDGPSIAAFEAAVADHRAQGGIVLIATHVPLGLPGATALSLDRFAPAETAP